MKLSGIPTVALFLISGVLTFCEGQERCGDPTFAPSDLVKDVKAKLKCFSEENSQLEQQLAAVLHENTISHDEIAALQSALAQRAAHLHLAAGSYNPDILPPEACKSRATNMVSNEGGTFLQQSQSTASYKIDDLKVLILCQAPVFTGYVIVVDDDDTAAFKAGSLANRLAQATFH